MFLRYVPAILTLMVVLTRADEEIEYEDDVMVLTDSNFDAAVENNKYLLVEFCKCLFFCTKL